MPHQATQKVPKRLTANAIVDWLETKVSMQLMCPCGITSHVIDRAIVKITCLACGKEYQMPMMIFPQEIGR
jgi:hypothetical protein